MTDTEHVPTTSPLPGAVATRHTNLRARSHLDSALLHARGVPGSVMGQAVRIRHVTSAYWYVAARSHRHELLIALLSVPPHVCSQFFKRGPGGKSDIGIATCKRELRTHGQHGPAQPQLPVQQGCLILALER